MTWILTVTDVCVYKTAQYSQGQTWSDGCQLRCRCDDSSKGLYVCSDRYSTLDCFCFHFLDRAYTAGYMLTPVWLISVVSSPEPKAQR